MRSCYVFIYLRFTVYKPGLKLFKPGLELYKPRLELYKGTFNVN